MAFTQADLDSVRAAIAKGERTVQFADRSVTYRSMEELLTAEAHIAAALVVPDATSPRQHLGWSGKGF